MQLGTIVEYTPRAGEPGYPALVMRVWQDGSMQLYAMHFEQAHQVRMAHPSEVRPILDPGYIDMLVVHLHRIERRLANLEERVYPADIKTSEKRLAVGMTGSATSGYIQSLGPLQVDASEIDVESTPVAAAPAPPPSDAEPDPPAPYEPRPEEPELVPAGADSHLDSTQIHNNPQRTAPAVRGKKAWQG